MNRRASTMMTAIVSAVVAAAATLVAVGVPAAANDRDRTGAMELGNPDYGVCRGVRPQCYHDWGNFDLSQGVRVLVYSRTAGPRHGNLGPALAPGLNPPLTDANVAQKAIARRRRADRAAPVHPRRRRIRRHPQRVRHGIQLALV